MALSYGTSVARQSARVTGSGGGGGGDSLDTSQKDIQYVEMKVVVIPKINN